MRVRVRVMGQTRLKESSRPKVARVVREGGDEYVIHQGLLISIRKVGRPSPRHNRRHHLRQSVSQSVSE